MNFVEEWLTRAKKETSDEKAIFKFFCLFIAFNYLYKSYRKKNRNNHYNSEFEQICDCVENAKKCIDNFDPYGVLTDESEILKIPVKSVRNIDDGCLQSKIDKAKLDAKDVNELFHSIYIVRCNLFHGSKQYVEDRDKKLVKESCAVLEYFLSNYSANYCLGE